MLVYVHGFNSSPASFKANLLKRALAERELEHSFRCPALSHWPSQAIAQLEELALGADQDQLTWVGSSLGGYYATYLVEKYGARAVLLNPAVRPNVDLNAYLGSQKNLYTGETYQLTPAHLEQLSALHVEKITRPERFFLITETGDEVIDYREGVMKFVHAKQLVIEGGDHALSDFAKYISNVLQFAGIK